MIALLDPLLPQVVSQELKGNTYKVFTHTSVQALPPNKRSQIRGIVCLLSHKIDKSFLNLFPNLKAIATFSVGTDHIDLPTCRAKKIRVAYTPDVLTRSTAELTLALTLAVARRFTEGEALCRNNRFKGWTPTLLLGTELLGKRAVLVGAGRIGKTTAKLFRALGMKTELIKRTDSESAIQTKLNQAQVVSLHLPLTPQTHHWLNAARIRALPPNAIVINTSRGGVIDQKALIRALRTRKILGAGLDVFEEEPKIPMTLRRLQNVVLLPHLGSATLEARTGMTQAALRGILGILRGQSIKNEVRLGLTS